MKAPVSFRLATAADAVCIGVLGTHVFLDTYATAGIRPALASEVLDHFSTSAISALLAHPDISFMVAEVANHIAGFCQLAHGKRHALALPGPSAEVQRLYVQRPFMGQGIGKALLHVSERLAADRGAVSCWLTAWVENQRALSFYGAQGYRDVGKDIYVYQGDEYENRVFVRETAGRLADST